MPVAMRIRPSAARGDGRGSLGTPSPGRRPNAKLRRAARPLPLPQRRRRDQNSSPRAEIRSVCIVPSCGEVVGAFRGAEGADDASDGAPEAGDGAFGGLAEEGLELGEGVLDRIEVGAVGWEGEELGGRGLDEGTDLRPPVAREIVP
jgi:hypothetical protein